MAEGGGEKYWFSRGKPKKSSSDSSEQSKPGSGAAELSAFLEKTHAKRIGQSAAGSESSRQVSSVRGRGLPIPGSQSSSEGVSSSRGSSAGLSGSRGSIIGRGFSTQSSGSRVSSGDLSSSRGSSEVPSLAGRSRGNLLRFFAQGKASTQSSSESKESSEPSEPDIPVECTGTSGEEVQLTSNWIRIALSHDKDVFEYDVKFEPNVVSHVARFNILAAMEDIIGDARSFDGCLLWLPIKLQSKKTISHQTDPLSGKKVTVTIRYHKRSDMIRCIHLYNVLFTRCARQLKMARVQRNYYLPSIAVELTQHQMEIWPGYVFAAHYQKGGIMLNVDVSHKLLRLTTVYEFMEQIAQKSRGNFRDNIKKELIGSVILTRYNSRTYRIDDVDFSLNPMSKFETSNGKTITYMEYYKNSYGFTINDRSQPLLVSKVKQRSEDQAEERKVHLLPEKSFLTGLTDDMRKDFRVMKDLAQHTRLPPHARQQSIQKFVHNVNNNKDCRAILKSWGIQLLDEQIHLEGRINKPEAIITAKGPFQPETPADWGREICRERVLSAVDVTRWVIIFQRRNAKCTHDFVDTYVNCVRAMGIRVTEPKYMELSSDTPKDYANALQRAFSRDLQLAVIVFPFQREDQYSSVKNMACHELGLPTQCIVSKTIMQDRKLRSITQKIALQINCKLGGELWAVKVPLKGLMVCGVDVYHDPSRRNQSVVGFVASMNPEGTRWHSHATFQKSGNEIIDSMRLSFHRCLEAYYKIHHAYPSSIVMYRDGVSDGMFEITEQHEIPQMSTVFERLDTQYNPEFYYVIVQKRINTRLIKMGYQGKLDNPEPGTIVDHTITNRKHYDFLLVSQIVRQGTVTPTHYIVLKNGSLEVDKMQKLTYKMTHMYYNWPGTVRVPAPCQYAHKLAYLMGENVKSPAKPNLYDTLFFL